MNKEHFIGSLSMMDVSTATNICVFSHLVMGEACSPDHRAGKHRNKKKTAALKLALINQTSPAVIAINNEP